MGCEDVRPSESMNLATENHFVNFHMCNSNDCALCIYILINYAHVE